MISLLHLRAINTIDKDVPKERSSCGSEASCVTWLCMRLWQVIGLLSLSFLKKKKKVIGSSPSSQLFKLNIEGNMISSCPTHPNVNDLNPGNQGWTRKDAKSDYIAKPCPVTSQVPFSCPARFCGFRNTQCYTIIHNVIHYYTQFPGSVHRR